MCYFKYANNNGILFCIEGNDVFDTDGYKKLFLKENGVDVNVALKRGVLEKSYIVNMRYMNKNKISYGNKRKWLRPVTNDGRKIRLQIENLKKRIMTQMPDDGSRFCNFAEDFSLSPNEAFVRATALSVKRDPNNDDKAYLAINLLHPTVYVNMSSDITYGTKQALLEYLNKEENI